jgi:hypothetical protein
LQYADRQDFVDHNRAESSVYTLRI